jgi:hypothetical protein
VIRPASETWFGFAENQMRADIVSRGDVPAVLNPEIQTANDCRMIKTTQPGPTGVQIEALLGQLPVHSLLYEMSSGTDYLFERIVPCLKK